MLFTNNDAAYEAAHDIVEAGGTIGAVVDCRPEPAAPLAPALSEAGVPLHVGSVIAATHGTKRVSSVTVAKLGESGGLTGERYRIWCDSVLVSGGWNPAVHLFSQSAGKLTFEEARGIFLPGRATQALEVAGAAGGSFGLGGVPRGRRGCRRARGRGRGLRRRHGAAGAILWRLRSPAPSRPTGSRRAKNRSATARPSTWSTTRTT